MLWKAGCMTVLVGLALTIGSCFFFKAAIDQAVETRQIANVPLDPGSRNALEHVAAEAGTRAKVSIEAQLELSDAFVESAGESGGILSLSMPVNYEVTGNDGERLHVEAGKVSGTVIVPGLDNPHRESFDRTTFCRFDGSGFPVPEDGSLFVSVDLPGADDDGNVVRAAHVGVWDRLPETAGQWVAGGFVSMLLGPALALVGGVLFLIGLIVGRRRTAATAG